MHNCNPSPNQNNLPLPKLLTYREAADWLGCSARTVYNYVRDGRLRCVKIAGVVRFSVDDLRDLMDRNRSRSGNK